MTIFVAKGLRLKLVINGIFMTKKIKNVCNVAQKKANIMWKSDSTWKSMIFQEKIKF